MSLPYRKHPRLKGYNYSKHGYYHVIINTYKNVPILSSVGRGLAPADSCVQYTSLKRNAEDLMGYSPAELCVKLTPIGRVAEEQLFDLKKRFSYIEIDKYVIMPNHIHVIIILHRETAGASPRPTLSDIVCAYKSLVTRICNKMYNTPGRKIFQTSFYESIIRNEKGYFEVAQYINNNPLKWIMENKTD